MAVTREEVAEFRGVLSGREYVSGLTHAFYRYPARFSPAFARRAITAFSRPGETVLDPFAGGGTTVVEALASGRRAIGVDLNSLAIFVVRSKTSPLSARESDAVRRWTDLLSVNGWGSLRRTPAFGELAKDIPIRVQRTIAGGLRFAEDAPRRARQFIRAVLLRVCQQAIDGREEIASTREVIAAARVNAIQMLDQLEDFRRGVLASKLVSPSAISRARRLIYGDAANLRARDLPMGWQKPRLVVTSPPYMGIHVLYNKWQVNGRRETKFPYAISGTPDGYFASRYTFGDRQREPELYLGRLAKAYSGVRRLLAKDALVVQLVSFSQPTTQLPLFLEAMVEAGFEEVLPPRTRRVWRPVPNRRWYYRAVDREEPESREVLLFHRPTRP